MLDCLSLDEFEAIALSGSAPSSAQQRHLEQCADCRGRLEEVRRNLKLLDAFAAMGATNLGRVANATPSTPADLDAVLPAGIEPDADEAGLPTIPGYEIETEIHRGAQGIVYRAIQVAAKRTVALKLLLHGPYASRRQRRRFEREIELVGELEHPNIVRLYESGDIDGRHYFAMQHIDGLPLHQYATTRALDVRAILRLMLKVSRAIAYAHARGIIHRDLKPKNILVDLEDEPHVLDFGLAKPIDAGGPDTLATMTGEFFGTLAYASPEQVSGKPGAVDARTDVYALGMILHELLTGSPPYPTTGAMSEVIRHIEQTDPPRLSSAGRMVDTEVDAIVRKALEKDADRRYATANALADDIERYLGGRPVEARPYSGAYALRKAIGRHKTVAALTAGSALCLIVLTVVALLNAGRAGRERDRAILAERETSQQRDRAVAAEALAADGARQAEQAEQRATREAREARRMLYFNRITMATHALEEEDTATLRQMLKDCPREFRGWEWYRLCWLSDRSALTYAGHGSDVLHSSFSPEGKYVYTVAADDILCLWDPRTGLEIFRLGGVSPHRANPIFRRDGTELLTHRKFGWVLALKIPSGQPRLKLRHGEDSWKVCYLSEGQQICSVGESTVKVWRASDGHLLKTLKRRQPRLPTYLIGNRLVTFERSPHALILEDMEDPTSRTVFEHADLEHHIFSTDEARLATLGGGSLKMWQVHPKRLLFEVSDLGFPASHYLDMRFGRDGRRFLIHDTTADWTKTWDVIAGVELRPDPRASSAEEAGRLRCWIEGDAKSTQVRTIYESDGSGKIRGVLRGHVGPVHSVSASPDGKWVVTASHDDTCKVWDIDTIGDAVTWQTGELHAVAFSPDGKRFAAGELTGMVRVWDVARAGELFQSMDSAGGGQLSAVAFSPDGSALVAAGGVPKVWNTKTWEEVCEFKGHQSQISSVAFLRDGRRIVTGAHERAARIWDAATGRQLQVLKHTGDVCELAVSHDGKWIATGGDARVVHMWNPDDGKLMRTLTGHTDEIDALAFSPDSRHLFSGDNDGHLVCWDVVAGSRVWSNRSEATKIYCAAFTPDGKRVITGGMNLICVWDAASGRLVMSWEHGQGRTYAIDISPTSGDLLSASPSPNAPLKLWPVSPSD